KVGQGPFARPLDPSLFAIGDARLSDLMAVSIQLNLLGRHPARPEHPHLYLYVTRRRHEVARAVPIVDGYVGQQPETDQHAPLPKVGHRFAHVDIPGPVVLTADVGPRLTHNEPPHIVRVARPDRGEEDSP